MRECTVGLASEMLSYLERSALPGGTGGGAGRYKAAAPLSSVGCAWRRCDLLRMLMRIESEWAWPGAECARLDLLRRRRVPKTAEGRQEATYGAHALYRSPKQRMMEPVLAFQHAAAVRARRVTPVRVKCAAVARR